jgi:hypothetical protein
MNQERQTPERATAKPRSEPRTPNDEPRTLLTTADRSVRAPFFDRLKAGLRTPERAEARTTNEERRTKNEEPLATDI